MRSLGDSKTPFYFLVLSGVMNIFLDSVNVYGISFYPNYDSEFYYVNPVDSDNYIVLDEYFDYLKQVRVGELQKIAQDLGAKHFRVTYKEENAFSSNDNITVMAVDTCPNALAMDTSDYFGEMLVRHVFEPLLKGEKSEVIERATILKNGQLTTRFSYLENFAKE